MKTTNYPGIDYSAHTGANMDTATGIRYGLISQRSLMAEAVDDIYTHGRDLGYENAKDELGERLRDVLKDYYSGDRLTDTVESVLDSLDSWSDNLELSGPYRYESDGLTVTTAENGELWVLASPYFTHAQFCSPCAPGAGNLDAHCPDGPRTYCLGHDWFDGGKAPYPVYSVATGELVAPEK